MSSVRMRVGIPLLSGVLIAILLIGCGNSTANHTSTKSSSASLPVALVTIPKGQELFAPFILPIQPHTTVTWQNNDTTAHIIMTTWDHSTFLNPQAFSLNSAAGQTTSFTFTKPGIYDYFDNTQSKWDETDHRVSAKKGVPNFPLAMEGIIWVQGPISGLSSSVTNNIPAGKDDFVADFLAIPQEGSVSWHNQDTDNHFIDLVNGWSGPINEVDLGTNEIKGIDDAPPGGGTTTIHFNKPGLYYYFCSAHASINTTWHRVVASPDASESPIPMEGFVLVNG